MKQFKEFCSKIEDIENRLKLESLFEKIHLVFPELNMEMKWNQPMFTLNNTFIIGFSVAKNHFSITPEPSTVVRFAAEIKAEKYAISKSNMLFSIKWKDDINFALIEEMIKYNIKVKNGCKSFWLS